jgi:uncharacterized protein YqeY
MSIFQQVGNEFLEARKSGDKASKDNLGVAYDYLQKAAKELLKTELTDDEAITILRKYNDQLKEEQAGFFKRRDFEKVNALHIAQEQIGKYVPAVPALLDEEGVKAAVAEIAAGIQEPLTMKNLMPAAQSALKGKAEGSLVSNVVRSFLQ